MIQGIINGIIAAIRAGYDKKFRIYTESVEQGLIEPCFSVLCLNSIGEQKAKTRRNRSYPCIIRYFPISEDEPRKECEEVMENLYELLMLIDAGSKKLRGKDMKGQIVDGVLQFEVTYAGFLLATKTETMMEELEVTTDGTN